MKHSFKRDILKGQILPLSVEEAARVKDDFLRYEKPETTLYSAAGRRMNHFMVGADPEFMIVNQHNEPVHATSLGLKAALAFGADQNDRLVELRPAPSRSALAVLGSTLAELRWLYRYLGSQSSENLLYPWVAPAFLHGDGMGGHVHFGRKRPHQAEEVRGLDGLAKTMRAAHLFDTEGWNRRSQGDQFRQVYGAYGDIRIQKHGYEYRTLPSWLDNPRLGFLVLTLTKLCMVDPDITADWTSETGNWSALRSLAKYYMGRDDDALLLYSMMEKSASFKYQGGDFRRQWGLTGSVSSLPPNFVIASVIEPTSEDIGDLYQHFSEGTPMVMRETQANWTTSVPDGYRWVPSTLDYRRRPNIGDILYDLVTHKSNLVAWDFDSRGCSIDVPNWYDRTALNKLRGEIVVRNSDHFAVRVGQEWRKGANLSHLRKVLLSGLLPIWTPDTVKKESFEAFKPKAKTSSSRSKYRELLVELR